MGLFEELRNTFFASLWASYILSLIFYFGLVLAVIALIIWLINRAWNRSEDRKRQKYRELFSSEGDRGSGNGIQAVGPRGSRNGTVALGPQLTAEQISEEIKKSQKRRKKILKIVASIGIGGAVLGIILAIILNKDKLVDIDSAVVGNRVQLGNYEWYVLDKKDDKLLVLSRYLICYQKYNEVPDGTEREEVTWSECSLRKWLNTEFLMQTFSAEELERITDTRVHTEDNWGIPSGDDTVDKVFLLSIEEAEKYATSYKVGHGEFADGNRARWWLRSPGYTGHHAASVEYNGSVSMSGDDVSSDWVAVRPALLIDLKTR